MKQNFPALSRLDVVLVFMLIGIWSLSFLVSSCGDTPLGPCKLPSCSERDGYAVTDVGWNGRCKCSGRVDRDGVIEHVQLADCCCVGSCVSLLP